MNSCFNNLLVKTTNQLNLFISGHGYINLNQNWNSRNVRNAYSRIYYILSGEGTLTAGNAEITLQPNHVYLVPSCMVFNYRCDSQLEKMYFHINIVQPDGYDLLSSCKKICVMPLDPGKVDELHELYGREDIYSALQLRRVLTDTICDFMREFNLCKEKISIYSPVVKDAISYIHSNLSIQLSVSHLADQLFVSKSMLTKQFHHEVGTTISNYIDDFIFLSAEHQLVYTEHSLKQISDSLGFCDQFYFSRRFHQKYGEPPSRYRKRMKKINLTNNR